MIYGIIVAAGNSTRFHGGNFPSKIFENLAGVPLLEHSLLAFIWAKMIDEIIVVCRECDRAQIEQMLLKTKPIHIVLGGSARQQSVYNALKFIEGSKPSCQCVVIHDAARPNITSAEIDKIATHAANGKNIIYATPETDTLKKIAASQENDELFQIESTIHRENIFRAQTPQAFQFAPLLAAHKKFKNESHTDDAQLLEHTHILLGNPWNIKVTTIHDLEVLNKIL